MKTYTQTIMTLRKGNNKVTSIQMNQMNIYYCSQYKTFAQNINFNQIHMQNIKT